MDPLKADILNNIQLVKSNLKSLRTLSTEHKNRILLTFSQLIKKNKTLILKANHLDLSTLSPEVSSAFVDRMTLNEKRLASMIEGIEQIRALPDPVGNLVSEQKLKNGLILKRVRAPLGAIFMIYEARPNVISEVFSLALKSGNGLILRGGSESQNTSEAIYQLINQAILEAKTPLFPFYGINDYDRSLVESLLKRPDLIDVVVPRGGEKLIEFVQATALMPIIKNDRGMCHTYVDSKVDLAMAVRVVKNAKVQRPGVCNSLETVLVHREIASDFVPSLYSETQYEGLQWKVDPESFKLLLNKKNVQLATPKDWDTESLDLVINCKIVSSIDEAIAHIETHGSRHSEAILTEDETLARKFQNEVDASAVYWNASTRFTDGFEFGLGGELGISTQKLHVRGPVGLNELTTPRWIIDGTGQIRT